MKFRDHGRTTYLSAMALVSCLAFAVASYAGSENGSSLHSAWVLHFHTVQQTFPAPPSDRTLTYWRAEKEAALQPLPVESATTTLRAEVPAGSDKMGRVDLKGETAQTLITSSEPHFFLFVPDVIGVHPPLLVRLTPKRGSRRVTAMAQRGQRGFAIISEEIVKPHYRVLRREGGTIYMEVWGREPLLPGEYAFIGSDLARIATFRVAPAPNH